MEMCTDKKVKIQEWLLLTPIDQAWVIHIRDPIGHDGKLKYVMELNNSYLAHSASLRWINMATNIVLLRRCIGCICVARETNHDRQ
jgi:hypothetical protein